MNFFAQRRYSLRRSLVWLVLAGGLPAVAVSAYFVLSNFQFQRESTRAHAALLARAIVADLDRELSGIESGLRVLATSQDLLAGDLNSFYRLASDAVASQIVYNYILTDRDGRQLLNTLRPLGDPLPETGTPRQLDRVFTEGRTVLSDLFTGPVTRKPAIAMGVPVRRGDEILYSLNIGLYPEKLGDILKGHSMREGWTWAILDSSATIVARSHESARFVGHKAVPMLAQRVMSDREGGLEIVSNDGELVHATFKRWPSWPWSVVVRVPKSDVDGGLYRMIAGASLAVMGAMAFGGWLAFALGRRVLKSVSDLNSAARALCVGGTVTLPRTLLIETDAIAEAITQASLVMAEANYRASHDPLTGLANRGLFEELLRHQVAQSKRRTKALAILAIDLDGFKDVNDLLGHATGDQVLRTVAERILATIRQSDVAARIGGDEFAVLLIGAEKREALQMGQRLVASLSAPYPGIELYVSASIGVAVRSGGDVSIEKWLESADRALYAAKAAGRQRAVLDDSC